MIPTEHVAADYNPERGFVSSANQRSTTLKYPYYYNGFFSDYRGRLLVRRLEEMNQIKVEDMIALQNDVYSLKAEEALPHLLPLIDASALNQDHKPILENSKAGIIAIPPMPLPPFYSTNGRVFSIELLGMKWLLRTRICSILIPGGL